MMRAWWRCGAMLLAALVVLGVGLAQDKPDPRQPGAPHKRLERLAGHWRTTGRFIVDPRDAPVVSEGSCEATMILGGRFLRQEISGTFAGKPFSGVGLWGFDNVRLKYVAVWVDDSGTQVLRTEGTWDEEKHSLTEVGEMDDPATGGKKKVRYVTVIESDAEHVQQMFETGADGHEVTVGAITYARKE